MKMDGIRHFKESCAQMKLDCNKFFQLGKSEKPHSERLQHRFGTEKRTQTQLFAVCYFEVDNIYVAWNLKAEKAKMKTVFSVKRASLDLPLEQDVAAARKAIGYSGWGEEDVLAFTPDGIKAFLEKYCKSTIDNEKN